MTEQFSLDEAMRAQRAMRLAAGLPDEKFEIDRLVGMLSDEIDALRERGMTDDDIVAVMSEATGKTISGVDIAEHYVSVERRHRG